MIAFYRNLNDLLQNNKGILFLAVFFLTLITRLPIVYSSSSYGLDPDAWRVVNVAKHIAIEKEYRTSRLPGYPVPEITYSMISDSGPFGFNLLTALISSVGIGYFALILGHFQCRDILLASLAFALLPAIYINSTNSMDYMWALTFALGALYFALTGSPRSAGIFLGIAIGCRLTSGAMVLPIVILLMQSGEQGKKDLISFIAAAGVTGLIVLAPVFYSYRLEYVTSMVESKFGIEYQPDTGLYAQHLTVLFGPLGLLGMVAALLSCLDRRSSESGESVAKKNFPRWGTVALLSGMGLFLLPYYWQPYESAYLIPLIPLLLLLAARYAKRSIFILMGGLFMVSPFYLSHSSADPNSLTPYGAVYNNFYAREINVGHAKYLINKSAMLSAPHVFVVGPSLPVVKYFAGTGEELESFVYLLSREDFKKYREQGVDVYFLRFLRGFNIQVHQFDLKAAGAKELS